MSASSTTLRGLPLEPSPLGSREPRGLKILYWSVSIPAVTLLIWSVSREFDSLASNWQVFLLWAGAVAAAELLSVPVYGTVVLTMALPVVLAAGMVFQPLTAGPIAFLGFLDSREFKGEISIGRGLYNRSQVMLSATGASTVFHALDGDLLVWPSVLPIAILVLSADWIANSALVALPTRFLTHLSFREVVKLMFGGRPADEAVGYVSLGLLAVPLALTYQVVGGWGLVAFLLPLFLARQMFAHGRRLDQATGMVEAKNQALAATAEGVADERRDERRVVAGDLHDEVLQPLYKVHLMGQVLRQDLDSGRLLDLDQDVPQLISATNAAQDAIRALMRDLRDSTVGANGLVRTLELLVRDVAPHTRARIELSADDVGGAPTTQLLAYQIVREALANAVRHSHAGLITIRLWRSGDDVHLLIEDDGRGFDPAQVDQSEHFGLQLLAERAEAASGVARVDSRLGRGTRVSASLPADGPWQI
jgi:signal transduction histidine kinase